MDLFTQSVPQFIKTLRNLGVWLEEASGHAEAKKFDPAVLTTMRLAPDQYALARQVQAACDTAKLTASRLSGRDAPPHPDTETTLEELRERIGKCIAFLETFSSDDFANAAEQKVSLGWMRGRWLPGDVYLTEFGLPNFYFHVVTAYSILRHAGVPLGKSNFIGGLPLRD
jgi:hypothetical protein